MTIAYKLSRTYINICHFYKSVFHYLQLLLLMNVMLDFICTGLVRLLGMDRERNIFNENMSWLAKTYKSNKYYANHKYHCNPATCNLNSRNTQRTITL